MLVKKIEFNNDLYAYNIYVNYRILMENPHFFMCGVCKNKIREVQIYTRQYFTRLYIILNTPLL